MALADDARALVVRTTTAQGIPEVVVDAGTLSRVAAIISAGRDSAPGHHSGALVNNTITATTRPTAEKGGSRGHRT